MTSHNDSYPRLVNPGFVKLLSVLGYGRTFVRAQGTRVWDETGREYIDFLAGFGVHNLGHNHPKLIGALQRALADVPPSMLNIDAPLCQGALASELNRLTHPELCRMFFANSGAEAVGMALKTAWAATGRRAILACHGAYHGLTPGALGITDAPSLHIFFGQQPQDVAFIPFGDIGALEQACATKPPAAFFMEPIQAEGGIRVPGPDYMVKAAAICRSHGTLLIADEIQTGLGRTGALFATEFDRVVPDILLLGKALSGGVVPIAVGMTRADVWNKPFSSLEHCNPHASTFAGGHLACTAAMAVLSVIREEDLVANTRHTGAILREGLCRLATHHPAIRGIRGRGLLYGIELESGCGIMGHAVPAWAREGLFAQVVCALLLRDHNIIAQPCSLFPNVLRIEPPLVIVEDEINLLLTALDRVLKACPSPAAAMEKVISNKLFGKAI